jgi:hypothetical protein
LTAKVEFSMVSGAAEAMESGVIKVKIIKSEIMESKAMRQVPRQPRNQVFRRIIFPLEEALSANIGEAGPVWWTMNQSHPHTEPPFLPD